MTTWAPDVLGDGYESTTIPLGRDPDGQGEVVATLVKHTTEDSAQMRGVVLYVHGFTDYFFQGHVASFFAARGYRFYALDLRKCGRSLRPGQFLHYTTDLAVYDDELERAVEIITADVADDATLPAHGEASFDRRIVLMAHSTGGLIVPLWLDRRRGSARADGSANTDIRGLILNSPWFDLQGPALVRSAGTTAISVLGSVSPTTVVPGTGVGTYGASISATAHGSWTYNTEWKPVTGAPIRFGWLRAIRDGHARLHRGLDVAVPSLVLRSRRSRFAPEYTPEVDTADAVLDVAQIARWAGCLGDRTTVVPVEGARHDVFLSEEGPRSVAFEEVGHWLSWLESARSTVGGLDPERPVRA